MNGRRNMQLQPRVRASVVNSVISAARAIGAYTWTVNCEKLCAGRMIDDPYQWVPLADYLELFEGLAQALNEPLLGLKISGRFAPDNLGPLGLLFINGSTIADGAAQMHTFIGAWQEETLLGVT